MALQELITYGVTASGTWASVANAAGPPNGTEANTAGSATLTVSMNGFASLPDNAVIKNIYLGARLRGSTTPSIYLATSLSIGGAALYPVSYTYINPESTTLVDREVRMLDPGQVTTAELKGPFDFIAYKPSGTTTIRVDAVWVRIEYTTDPVIETRGYAVSASGAWTLPANAIGAPDGKTTYTSSVTTAQLTVGFAALDVPDGVELIQVNLGIRSYGSIANGSDRFLLSNDPLIYRYLWPIPPTVLTDVETRLDPTQYTPELLRSGTITANITQQNGSNTNHIDAVWLRAVWLAEVEVDTRFKRHDGSGFVEAQSVRRYDGSQWIEATTKRYDGSSWQ